MAASKICEGVKAPELLHFVARFRSAHRIPGCECFLKLNGPWTFGDVLWKRWVITERGTGYGQEAAQLRVHEYSEVEDVRMTRPAAIPGTGTSMGASSIMGSRSTWHVLRAGFPQSAFCTPRAQKRHGALPTGAGRQASLTADGRTGSAERHVRCARGW